MIENIQTASPAEIDAELNTLGYEMAIAQARAEQYSKIEGYEATAAKFAARVDELIEQLRPLNDEFVARGGWTRAFLVVTNGSGGHVHRNRSCSTCFFDTDYAWMTTFSGMDEAEIVDAAGERACTICYPTAPVATLSKATRMFTEDEKRRADARVERAAKKAEKEAARVLDPITGKVVANTEKGATNEIASTLDSFFWYGDHPSNDEWLARVDVLITALAARRGVEKADLRAELFAKAEAKNAKQVAKVVRELRADPLTNWGHVNNTVRVAAGLEPITGN